MRSDKEAAGCSKWERSDKVGDAVIRRLQSVVIESVVMGYRKRSDKAVTRRSDWERSDGRGRSDKEATGRSN